MRKFWERLKERRGQSLVEYALILALVAIVVITALTAIGTRTESVLNEVGNTLESS